MKKLLPFFFLLCLIVSACSPSSKNRHLQTGNWLFQLHINEQQPELLIPFNVEVITPNKLLIKNAEESIAVKEVLYRNDSVFIKMPVFGSEFKGKITAEGISGEYWNYNKSKVSPIGFSAKYNVQDRFEIQTEPAINLSGTWQARFGNDESASPAIGIFKQDGNYISGTFQTEIGDYRYLQGVVNGNTMQLSCFDGAHAFLFVATHKQGQLEGMFYSGNTWVENWNAEKTDNPVLGNMKKLTFLKPGYETLHFAFPNQHGDTISLQDSRYRNKVVIVQIFGTWCPNCMDETRYLVELYKKYNAHGLEIIGLDFEPNTDFAYFKNRIARFRKDLEVPYELLLAGPANKKLAAEALPMLNKVISYPTALFIDRNGKISEIHTGFSGPGTGINFEHYKSETEELIEQLLNQ